MIYLAIKYHPTHENRSLIENICLACENAGETCLCITKDIEKWGKHSFNPQQLMDISFEKIRNSDLVLVEFSEKGVGVGIEAGYAFALNIPIIVLHPSKIEVSETLKGIAAAVYPYQGQDQIARTVELIISDFYSTIKNH